MFFLLTINIHSRSSFSEQSGAGTKHLREFTDKRPNSVTSSHS